MCLDRGQRVRRSGSAAVDAAVVVRVREDRDPIAGRMLNAARRLPAKAGSHTVSFEATLSVLKRAFRLKPEATL